MSKIGINESDFVKDKRQNHCKGCMNENGYCSATEVLSCWLRKTYLPEDEWYKAMESDVITENINEISDAIDRKILEDMKKEEQRKSKRRYHVPVRI